MDRVTRAIALPRVFGLKGDTVTHVRKMMDSDANICVTGILGILVDIKVIHPLPISVATSTNHFSLNACCTKKGLIHLTLTNGSTYYQECYYCKNATETIISPDAILQSSNTLVSWYQEGHKQDGPGSICFTSKSGLYSITLSLEKHKGLYYCPTDMFTISSDSAHPNHLAIKHIALPATQAIPLCRRDCRYQPVNQNSFPESELWMQLLGTPGEDQLSLLPTCVMGIPSNLQHHPFHFIDWREEAGIQKQAAQCSAERTTEARRRYYMDFGFMRASTSYYDHPGATSK